MNKISFIMVLILFSAVAQAASFGRIVEIKGEGFISHGGKTKDLRVGDIIEYDSEIVLENSAQATFTDNADHRFHIGNSSSVAVFHKHVELRNGDMWFQSLNRTDDYKLTTANAAINYQGGEAILSYDSVKGKTQLMVISSVMKLSNLRSADLNLSVAEGNFSFIDNTYEEGAPRDPTPVGEKTYHQLITLFKNVTPLEKNAVQTFKHNDSLIKRGIASSSETHVDLESYKTMLFEKATETKVSNVTKVSSKKKKTKSVPIYASTLLEIKFYGMKASTTESASSALKSRTPASVFDTPVSAPEAHINPATNTNDHYKELATELINQLNKL